MKVFIGEIQAKLERTYEAGRNMEMVAFDRPGGLILETSRGECRRRGSSLGRFAELVDATDKIVIVR